MRFRTKALSIAAAFASLFATSVGFAQPDVREIRPVVMLLIDSSGSMERVGDCVCTTATCVECMPDCAGGSPSRNRWANVLEVLTGQWNGYSCSFDTRRVGTSAAGFSYSGQPDENYHLGHTNHLSTSQTDNGILDTYVDRVKFGLMTFDGVPTWVPRGPLVRASEWSASLSQSAAGDFSYAGDRTFRYRGCPDNEDRVVNNGARSETATSGRLVSVGSDGAIPDHTTINATIQSQLLNQGLRPHGSTPVAGMLEDLEYYFDNHPDVRPRASGVGDPYRLCRARYAILLTDGRPSADFRGAPYYCEDYSGADRCPYEEPVTTAATLTASSGPLDGLYVIGMNIRGDDSTARAELNAIAAAGQTCPSGGGDCARFPSNPSDLRTDFEEIMRQANPGTTTRTVPAFSSGGINGGAQMQFQTGFNPTFSVLALGYQPWEGVLERRRYECDGLNPVAQPIDSSDRFGDLLNGQGARTLYTVLPPTATDINGHLVGPERDSVTGVPVPASDHVNRVDLNVGRAAFSATDVTPPHLGITVGGAAANALRDSVVAWVHGDSGTNRADKRLGSIYHSSPIVIGPPGADRADETFNEYRQTAAVANRPRVVYVGTNDGILHAFAAEDYTRIDATTVTGGTELWGFIPPMLLDELEDTMTGHQWMVDGTPVVQEVLPVRIGAGTAADWRTVLVMGLRGGGRGFFALDVTDPEDPKFLWQFTHADLGPTYGQPRLAQVNVQIGATAVHQRTVAILPGGAGTPTGGTTNITDSRHIPGTVAGLAPRTTRREWSGNGRSLFVVDVLTGRVLRSFDDLPAPMTGGVSVFPGTLGTDAEAAYFNDHDGVIWRLDLSSTDPDDWDYQAIWDMFHDQGPHSGQPAYYPPVLSTTDNGNVVIIQATGDNDNLEDTSALNRVVSLREQVNVSGTPPRFSGVTMTVNWELQGLPSTSPTSAGIAPGEQIAGPIELFNGVVYFGTFATAVNANDACSFGYSRLWGVDYIENEGTIYQPSPRLTDSDDDQVAFLDRTEIPALDNSLLVGVGIASRPRCSTITQDPTATDPYLGTSRTTHHVTAAGAPNFQLVAQISGAGTGTAGASVATVSIDLETPPSSVASQGSLRRVE